MTTSKSHEIALKLLEQPIVAETPYLHFNPLCSAIFQLLVPAAVINPNVRTYYTGTTFKLPTTTVPGKPLPEIPPRALPGYLDRNPYAGYVTLEADDDDLAKIRALCAEHSAYDTQNVLYIKDNQWWEFGCKAGHTIHADFEVPAWHEINYVYPLRGQKPPREPIASDAPGCEYWLAVEGYYGTERKKHGSRYTQAKKITASAFNIINHLYHDQITNLTTPRSTYRHILFNDTDTLKHTHGLQMYFRVTGKQLKQLETVSKKLTEIRCHVWLDDGWYLMPNAMGLYWRTIGGEYPYRPANPQFAPTFLPPTPGAATNNDNQLLLRGRNTTITYSEKIPGQPGWWWIEGDTEEATKSIRHELRRFGCEWSRGRQQWFLKDTRELPNGLRRLLGIQDNPVATPKSPPPEPQPSAAPVAEIPAPTSLSAPARTQPKAGEIWVIDGQGFHPLEEATPQPEPQPEPGLEPEPELELPPSVITTTAEQLLAADETARSAIQTAALTIKTRASSTQHRIYGNNALKLPQHYVGVLTGAINGNVYCYGYAIDRATNTCIYLNLGGPRMAVEAIKASLALGKMVNLIPDDGPAVELTAGEDQKGRYRDYFANLPEKKFTSLILLHKLMTEPIYNERSTTYLIALDDQQARQKLYDHIALLLDIPLFEHWTDYLWEAGSTAMLLRSIASAGGPTVYAIDLDKDAWNRLISGALSQNIIQLGA